jgi:subfamily B ATP-binding cassette protein MsbA
VVAGTFTLGGLVAYLGYLAKLYGPAKKLSKVNFSIQKILASAERIFDVMGLAPEEAVNPRGAGGRPMFVRRGAPAVTFQGVTFEYEPGRPALQGFDLAVDPGEVVALVGRSGAGKTTLVNLLLRFYEPTAGRVFIDDVPLDSVPLPELRREIGLVQQDVFLFSGSIAENIAYARPDAIEQEIVTAARMAHAHDFIVRIAGGYGAQIGERGVKLSGGQRQRLAIARALLRDPRVLIFDEATSHLDSESERLVQEALQRVARGRTVFVIAHRLSTVERADRIVLLDDGALAAVGSHDQLVVTNSLYRRLHSLQAGRVAAAAGTPLP